MESDLVESQFDNSNIGILPVDAISIIKQYFNEKLPSFSIKEEHFYTGYWVVKFINQEMGVFFDGDIGGVFSIYVIIGEKEYPLWQYDRSVNNAMKTNRKNILYQLEVLKRFLSENSQ